MKRTIRYVAVLLVCFLFSTVVESRPQLEHLKSGSLEQQITAMYYFGYSKNKGCFWYLVKNLTKTFGSELEDGWGGRFRQAAAESLGRLGDDRAVPFLIQQYKDEKKDEVKKSIIFALGFYRHKDIPPILSESLKSDKREILIEALQASAACGDKSVVPGIKALSDKKDDKVIGVLSSYALVMLGEEPGKHGAYLKDRLIDADPAIRFWSAYCLAQTDRIDAIDNLIKAMEIENYPWVKKEMESALVLLSLKRKKDLE